MKTWALNDAKTQFSEVIEQAQHEAQIVTKHGRETAVVLSINLYRQLLPQQNAWDELRPNEKLLSDTPEFQRLETPMRNVDFEE
jgi:prevent-host-death family protein